MARHALLIGSQTGQLQGVHSDVDHMAARLDRFRFDVIRLTGKKADRQGILAAYDRLEKKLQSGDAAVVYYSGHGALEKLEGGEASARFGKTRYQTIVPFDYAESTDRDFRGILAEELSIRLARLTRKTSNVTVIFDCCHSSGMVRNTPQSSLRARALPDASGLVSAPQAGVEARLAEILGKHQGAELQDALSPHGNPKAVRLYACRTEQSAYEQQDANGDSRGLFTEALLAAFDEAKSQDVTWREIGEAARERVLSLTRIQRPEIEGPADRVLFKLEERARSDSAPAVQQDGKWLLRRGSVHGVRVGDCYALAPPGRYASADDIEPGAEMGRGKVTDVQPTESTLSVRAKASKTAPSRMQAVPVSWAERPRVVRVPRDSESRAALVKAIEAEKRFTVVEKSDSPLATVAVHDGLLSITDVEGQPMIEPRSLDEGDLASQLQENLRRMARAQALRDLRGNGIDGVAPRDVEIEIGLLDGDKEKRLPASGATIHPGDGLFVKVRNGSAQTVYAHVLTISAADEVSVLTSDVWPSGITLGSGREEVLSRDPRTGKPAPFVYVWPEGCPKDGPRACELLLVCTESPCDLTGLEQPPVRDDGEGLPRLRQLLDQVMHGTRRKAAQPRSGAPDGLLVTTLPYWANPAP